MYCIEIPGVIKNIFTLLYCLGIWHREDEATVRQTSLKIFYSIYYLLFVISVMAGAITSDTRVQLIFSAGASIAITILSMKLLHLIWRKKEILEILILIGVYSIEDHEVFTLVTNKLTCFTKFVIVLIIIVYGGAVYAVVIPIFRNDKEIFFKIGFPLDWRSNEFSFWLATAFSFTELTINLIAFLYSIIIWYLMVTCALRYETLGSRIRNMGVIRTSEATTNKRNVSEVERQNSFLRDLKAAIEFHQQTRELIIQVEYLVSNLFFIQILTTGLCICGSIYCLAFNEILVEQLIHIVSRVYYIAEIFMIMFFGNEIKCSSDRLMYCLFEANWIDQPQAIKKYIITFAELLKQPQELLIGQLYPLTLKTFTRILNFAYNTFNILKNVKL